MLLAGVRGHSAPRHFYLTFVLSRLLPSPQRIQKCKMQKRDSSVRYHFASWLSLQYYFFWCPARRRGPERGSPLKQAGWKMSDRVADVGRATTIIDHLASQPTLVPPPSSFEQKKKGPLAERLCRVVSLDPLILSLCDAHPPTRRRSICAPTPSMTESLGFVGFALVMTPIRPFM